MRAVLCSVALMLVSAQQAEAGTATATVTGTITGGYSVKYLNGEETFLRYYDGEPFTLIFQIDYDNPGALKSVYTVEEHGLNGEMIAGSVIGSGNFGEGFAIPVSASLKTPYETFSALGNYQGYAVMTPGGFAANVGDALYESAPGFERWIGLSIGASGNLEDAAALNPFGRLNVSFESSFANTTFSYLYFTDQYYIWDDGYFNDVRLDLNVQRLVYVASSAAVPEPSTWAMLLLGFGAVGWTLRRPVSSSAKDKRVANPTRGRQESPLAPRN